MTEQPTSTNRQAVVVGAGPNGLTAAITLAQAGYGVSVLEAEATVGGGARSAELTLPGFIHDICSAIHPLGAGSPVFCTFPLPQFGLEWVQPPIPLAHPLDDGTAVILERSVDATAAQLGADGDAYRRLMKPWVEHWEELTKLVLAPLRIPQHPFALARFGWHALRPATSLARQHFGGERARALFAGLAAHSMLPLHKLGTSAIGLMLGVAGHAVGWPFPRGGSQKISDALAEYARSLGVEIRTGTRVQLLQHLPQQAAIMCDVTPRQLLGLAQFPPAFRRRLERFHYGMAAYKVDWALNGPIPWRAAECRRAGTVHLGGTLQEIAAAEEAAWSGRAPERPFVLLAQHSLFDDTRAPAGKQTAWAYCHVPNGSKAEMLERIEAQVERFAPGFRELVLARSVMPPAELERHNANLVGGDISGGSMELSQIFLRPTARLYTTPLANVYICSSSTPPGPGVHGLCGYFAAQACLKDWRRTSG